MHIVTGGAGFIGSAFVAKLNQQGIDDILVVDELESSTKWRNLLGKRFRDYIHKSKFLELLASDALHGISSITHLGACSSTTETNVEFLMENNYRYSRTVAEYALGHKIRFIYASSAATYGDGAHGYSDEDATTPRLEPLNPYGFSKQIFDLWALRNNYHSKMVGIKFFNVFGPNEGHKGEMRSMVMKAFEQIKARGFINLYRSYRPEFADGEQKRDFIYVKDCTEVMFWLLTHPKVNGIFNLGTGKARSWNDLARAMFGALGVVPDIRYVEMPESIRNQYQYFTEAPMGKLKATGCPCATRSLEEAVTDYASQHLSLGRSL